MGTASRLVVAAALTGVVILSAVREATVQRARGAVAVSAGQATNPDDLRRWDAAVDRMARDGVLAPASRLDDGLLPGRVHEYLVQYAGGVPVHGGGVARQLDRGVTVSLLGTVYEGIDVGTAPGIGAAEAAARMEGATGLALAHGASPRLVVLPLHDGSYALAYRAALEDARVHFADAADGGLLHAVNAFDAQEAPAVGPGFGVGGSERKMSTTRETARRYVAHDRLRPAGIITLTAGFDRDDYERLIASGPAGVARWTADDIAWDRDNEWHQSAVVDAHVNMGLVYDYFFEAFEWAGVDGDDTRIVALVNVDLPDAFTFHPPFGPEGTGLFVFGQDGFPIVSLETVAHEMMHGVTHAAVSARTGGGLLDDTNVSTRPGPTSFTNEADGATYTCGSARFPIIMSDGTGQMLPAWCDDAGRFLLASDQGGAVAEALSDVIGEALQMRLGGQMVSCQYLVRPRGGENCPTARRSLRNPWSLGNPGHYGARVEFALVRAADGSWHYSAFSFVGGAFAGLVEPDPELLDDPDYEPTMASDVVDGGRHLNSTILSHAYYLAVEGGQAVGLPLEGIGGVEDDVELIQRIFFRAMTDLMPQATSLPRAADAIRQSAADLAPDTEAQQSVEDALTAVGL